jgi:methionyl-tRNA formyltransferase
MITGQQLILFLGYDETNTNLLGLLRGIGAIVEHKSDKVADLAGYDAVFSYGYRHILSASVIKTAKRPPINLHISYLPYNRGAHPHFWALVDGTPSGVTIHEIDSGIDTGPIIFQRRIEVDPAWTTFVAGHQHLLAEIEALFAENVAQLLAGTYVARPQEGIGTYHALKDLPEFVTSWDVDVRETIALIASRRQLGAR